MKRYFVFLCFLFLLAGVIAPHDEVSNSEVEDIVLMWKDGKIYWEVDGYSENGFKVVWSKNPGPTYPLRDGDKYHYYSEPERNYDSLEAFGGEGEYYVRVCEYLGGECGVYSNEIVMELGDDDYEEKEKEEYDDDKYEVEKGCEYVYEDGEKKYECENEEKEKYEYKYEKEEEGEYSGDKKKYGEMTEDSCDGCFVDEKCYYFTHRKDKMYCSYEGVFVNQTENEGICENNFECQSNVCAGGECVDAGLIKKVLNWLKNFFS